MALTSPQKVKVLQLLGYPGGSLDSASVLYDKVLSDRLSTPSADTVSLVQGLLTQISAIELQLNAAPARTISLQVGDIKINPDEIQKLRRERKTLAKEIGSLLDVPYVGRGSIMVGVSV